MASEPSYTLVLKDGEGACYILTPDLLAEARATPEQQRALEQELTEADTAGFKEDRLDVTFTLTALPAAPGGTPILGALIPSVNRR